MRDNYDFSDAVRNPFAGRTKGIYTVIIHYDFTENAKEQGDMENDNRRIDGDAETVRQYSVFVTKTTDI